MGKYADITISCIQCGKGFIFSEDEQEFYKSKGFTPPLRCKQCRSAGRQHNACTKCGNKLVEGSPVYCAACQINLHLEYEVKIKNLQSTLEAAGARVEASVFEKEQELAAMKESLNLAEAERVRLMEEARRTEAVVESENAKMRGSLEDLVPILNALKEKIEVLERDQNSIKESLLILIERTEQNNGNASLLESIRGLFRLNHRSPAQGE